MLVCRPVSAVLVGTALLWATKASIAGASTSGGQISVVQVTDMLERAPSNAHARQLLTAYLAGVGESVGALIDLAGSGRIRCKGRLTLTDAHVRSALAKAQAGQDRNEMPATPLIVREMMTRAGCGLED